MPLKELAQFPTGELHLVAGHGSGPGALVEAKVDATHDATADRPARRVGFLPHGEDEGLDEEVVSRTWAAGFRERTRLGE